MADNGRDVVDLWRNQTAEGFRMSQTEMQRKVQALDSKVRSRTRGVYLVCGILIIAFSTWAVYEHDVLMRLGAAATVIANVFLGFQAYRNRSRIVPASTMAAPSVEHLRSELQRQADFHRGKRFWSRMVLIGPAALLFFFAFARAHPELIAIIRFEIATAIVALIAAIPLNLSVAKKYQRQIEELDRYV